MSEVDLVEIRLEDLLLGVVLLHLARGVLLAILSRNRHLAAVDDVGMHVPDELLGDGTAATAVVADDLADDRAGDGTNIDAVVLVEALILHSDECLRDVRVECLERDASSKFVSDLAEQGLAIASENECRLGKRNDCPRLARRARSFLGGRGLRRDDRGDGRDKECS